MQGRTPEQIDALARLDDAVHKCFKDPSEKSIDLVRSILSECIQLRVEFPVVEIVVRPLIQRNLL